MSIAKTLKLVTAIFESILAIPVCGGIIVLSTLWFPLGVMVILHIVTLVICSEENAPIKGNIVGIVASLIGIIPVIGLIMHIISAILLWIDFSEMNDDNQKSNNNIVSG